MSKLRIPAVIFVVVLLLCDVTPSGASTHQWSGWRRRRERGEMTHGLDDDDYEVARISVSTGTTGGGEPAASADDPPDKETFNEDVQFDINYQQNGRVIGTVKDAEQPDGGSRNKRRSERRRSPTSDRRRRHHRWRRNRNRKQLLRREGKSGREAMPNKRLRAASARQTRPKDRAGISRRQSLKTDKDKIVSFADKRRQTGGEEADDENGEEEEEEEKQNEDAKNNRRRQIRLKDGTTNYLQASRNKVAKEKRMRDRDRQIGSNRRARTDEADAEEEEEYDDDEKQEHDRETKGDKEGKQSQTTRHDEYLVKDINDYFRKTAKDKTVRNTNRGTDKTVRNTNRGTDKTVRNTNRGTETRQTSREKASDEEEDEDEKDDEDRDVTVDRGDKSSQRKRYDDYLVKKDINDYFVQSKNSAAEDEEVFDRSERAEVAPPSGRRHNVTVHGGKKLAVVKSTSNGIEVDIDQLGRAEEETTDLGDVVPPWLRDQIGPEFGGLQTTLTDLDKVSHKVKHENTMNHMDMELFSENPQVELKWKEPKTMSNCWIHAMLATYYSFSPSCNPDGTYLAKQCYLERCWCVDHRGEPVVKSAASRFYYKKEGIRLHCAEVPVPRGQRPPALPTTRQPSAAARPESALGPAVNDEGPVVISKGQAAFANIPIHFQFND